MQTELRFLVLAIWIGVLGIAPAQAESLLEHCKRASFSEFMDCQCVADREDELRNWASETHATGNVARRIESDQRQLEARKQHLASETRPQQREMIQSGIDVLEERIARRSEPQDPSIHQYRTLYTYFDDNMECRSYDKAYASSFESCQSSSRNMGDAADAYCTCVAETTATQWITPAAPERPHVNARLACRE